MDYDALLDKIHAVLPEKKSSGERFEIPIISAELVGVRTVVKGFDVICQKIRRNPDDVARYLFKELATPGNYANGTLTLNTKINFRLLGEKFVEYVKSHVICRVCGKPDTHIVEVDRGLKTLICEACGARNPILK